MEFPDGQINGDIMTKVQELDHATLPHWCATQAQPIEPPASHPPNHLRLIDSTTCRPDSITCEIYL